jgi:hypothetical protein
MIRQRLCLAILLVVVAFAAAPSCPAQPVTAATPTPNQGFVPVAIWEISRVGFSTARHAWVAGSDKMLRISYDDGITWYGFRPIFSDTARQMLAVGLLVRAEIGRGEVAWREFAQVALVKGVAARATLPATATAAMADVTLTLVEVKEVAPTEIKPADSGPDVASTAPGGNQTDGAPGGPGSCCVTCNGVRVCDCSVCMLECHASCCQGGCFCLTC